MIILLRVLSLQCVLLLAVHSLRFGETRYSVSPLIKDSTNEDTLETVSGQVLGGAS